MSLQAAGLEEGDHLTAVAVEAKIATAGRAFAVFCSGGNQVVSWGAPGYGGDSSEVTDSRNRVRICCNPGGWVSRDLGQSTFWW